MPTWKPSDGFKTIQVLSWSLTYTHVHEHTKLIDFILTYTDEVKKKKKKGEEDTDEKKEKRRAKRQRFLDSCVELGLEYELQDCTVCDVLLLH